jgi:hypothetical protein
VGFAVGSRFKGSVRNGLNGAIGAVLAVGSRFKGSIRDGSYGAVGADVGASCDGRIAGARRPATRAASSGFRRLAPVQGAIGTGGGSKAAGSAGSGTVRAVCGIAGFLAVCLTDMVGVPNRSGKEPHSGATGRSPPGESQGSAPGPPPVQARPSFSRLSRACHTRRLNDRLAGAEPCDIPAMPTCHCELATGRRRPTRPGWKNSIGAVLVCVRQPFRRLV